MASHKKAKERRDSGAFSILPHVVLTSPGWLKAGHTARSLFPDLLMTYTGKNNGKLTATQEAMSAKGWRSPSVLCQAIKELVSCGLLLETRKGGFPNKTSWYALTFLDLDQTEGLDIDPKLYQKVHRGAYMRPEEFMRPKRPSGKTKKPATRRVSTASTIDARRVSSTKSLNTRRVAIEAETAPCLIRAA